MRIGDLELVPNSFDEKVEEEYISLDTLFATLVSTARSNQTKQSEVLDKQPIKDILWKRIQKEKRYATPKNIKFRAYELAKMTPTPSLPTFINKTTPKQIVPDVNLVAKKILESKRHL